MAFNIGGQDARDPNEEAKRQKDLFGCCGKAEPYRTEGGKPRRGLRTLLWVNAHGSKCLAGSDVFAHTHADNPHDTRRSCNCRHSFLTRRWCIVRLSLAWLPRRDQSAFGSASRLLRLLQAALRLFLKSAFAVELTLRSFTGSNERSQARHFRFVSHSFGARGFNLGIGCFVTPHSLTLCVLARLRRGDWSNTLNGYLDNRSAGVNTNAFGYQDAFDHTCRG